MIEQLIANFHGGGRFVFWMLIPAAMLWVGLALWRRRRQRNPMSTGLAAWISFLDAAIAWTILGMLVVAFYGYNEGAARKLQLIPLQEFFTLDDGNDPYGGLGLLVGNVMLYVPIGLLVALRVPRWTLGQIAIGAAAASAVIETLQYILPSGRVASVDDLILNVAGATLGALLAAGLARVAGSRRGRPESA